MKKILRHTAILPLIFFTSAVCFGEVSFVAAPLISLEEITAEFDFQNVKLPKNLGRIIEQAKASSDQTVIIIQDAHGVPDAQRSIQKIISYFQHKGISLIGLEGASARLDPRIFRSFPDLKILEKKAQVYFDRGELTGTTAAAILNPRPGEYQGLENWTLYETGLSLYLASLERTHLVEGQIQKMRKDLNEQKKKNYSAKLLEIDEAWNEFENGKANLDQLLKLCLKENKPLAGTELEIISRDLLRENKAFDAVLIRELTNVVKSQLTNIPQKLKELNTREQSYLTSETSEIAYCHYLWTVIKQESLSVAIPEALNRKVVEHQKLHAIEGTKLFEELSIYVGAVKEKFLVKDEWRNLNRKDFELRLLGKLSRLELSRKEYEMLKDPDFQSKQFHDVFKQMNVHRKFYENALSREQVLGERMENLLREKNKKSGLVIAGGFHAEGLKRLFLEKGINTVVIAPRIDSLPARSLYQEHMKGHFSWADYYQEENGQVRLYDAFVRGFRDFLLGYKKETQSYESLNFAPLWRDQIIRDLAKEERLLDAYQYTRFLDEMRSHSSLDLISVAHARVERFARGLRQLEASGQIDQPHILKLLQTMKTVDSSAAVLTNASLPFRNRRFYFPPDKGGVLPEVGIGGLANSDKSTFASQPPSDHNDHGDETVSTEVGWSVKFNDASTFSFWFVWAFLKLLFVTITRRPTSVYSSENLKSRSELRGNSDNDGPVEFHIQVIKREKYLGAAGWNRLSNFDDPEYRSKIKELIFYIQKNKPPLLVSTSFWNFLKKSIKEPSLEFIAIILWLVRDASFDIDDCELIPYINISNFRAMVNPVLNENDWDEFVKGFELLSKFIPKKKMLKLFLLLDNTFMIFVLEVSKSVKRSPVIFEELIRRGLKTIFQSQQAKLNFRVFSMAALKSTKAITQLLELSADQFSVSFNSKANTHLEKIIRDQFKGAQIIDEVDEETYDKTLVLDILWSPLPGAPAAKKVVLPFIPYKYLSQFYQDKRQKLRDRFGIKDQELIVVSLNSRKGTRAEVVSDILKAYKARKTPVLLVLGLSPGSDAIKYQIMRSSMVPIKTLDQSSIGQLPHSGILILETIGMLPIFMEMADITVLDDDRNPLEAISGGAKVIFYPGSWYHNHAARQFIVSGNAGLALKDGESIAQVFQQPLERSPLNAEAAFNDAQDFFKDAASIFLLLIYSSLTTRKIETEDDSKQRSEIRAESHFWKARFGVAISALPDYFFDQDFQTAVLDESNDKKTRLNEREKAVLEARAFAREPNKSFKELGAQFDAKPQSVARDQRVAIQKVKDFYEKFYAPDQKENPMVTFRDRSKANYKQVSLDGKTLESLAKMTQIARRHNVQLSATVYLKQGRSVGVDFLDDEKKLAIIRSVSNDEQRVTENPIYYSYPANALKSLRQSLNDALPGEENNITSLIRLLGRHLREQNAELELYSVRNQNRYKVSAAFLEGIENSKQAEDFISDVSNAKMVATTWFGSLELTKNENKVEHDEAISIHNHPNGNPTPPSAINAESSIGDIYQDGFFSGQIHGLILDTPQGDRLFLFYEPRDTPKRKKVYENLYRLYWYNRDNTEAAIWKPELQVYGPSGNWWKVLVRLREEAAMKTNAPVYLKKNEANAQRSEIRSESEKFVPKTELLNRRQWWDRVLAAGFLGFSALLSQQSSNAEDEFYEPDPKDSAELRSLKLRMLFQRSWMRLSTNPESFIADVQELGFTKIEAYLKQIFRKVDSLKDSGQADTRLRARPVFEILNTLNREQLVPLGIYLHIAGEEKKTTPSQKSSSIENNLVWEVYLTENPGDAEERIINGESVFNILATRYGGPLSSGPRGGFYQRGSRIGVICADTLKSSALRLTELAKSGRRENSFTEWFVILLAKDLENKSWEETYREFSRDTANNESFHAYEDARGVEKNEDSENKSNLNSLKQSNIPFAYLANLFWTIESKEGDYALQAAKTVDLIYDAAFPTGKIDSRVKGIGSLREALKRKTEPPPYILSYEGEFRDLIWKKMHDFSLLDHNQLKTAINKAAKNYVAELPAFFKAETKELGMMRLLLTKFVVNDLKFIFKRRSINRPTLGSGDYDKYQTVEYWTERLQGNQSLAKWAVEQLILPAIKKVSQGRKLTTRTGRWDGAEAQGIYRQAIEEMSRPSQRSELRINFKFPEHHNNRSEVRKKAGEILRILINEEPARYGWAARESMGIIEDIGLRKFIQIFRSEARLVVDEEFQKISLNNPEVLRLQKARSEAVLSWLVEVRNQIRENSSTGKVAVLFNTPGKEVQLAEALKKINTSLLALLPSTLKGVDYSWTQSIGNPERFKPKAYLGEQAILNSKLLLVIQNENESRLNNRKDSLEFATAENGDFGVDEDLVSLTARTILAELAGELAGDESSLSDEQKGLLKKQFSDLVPAWLKESNSQLNSLVQFSGSRAFIDMQVLTLIADSLLQTAA